MAGRKGKYKSHVKPYIDRIPKWRKDGFTEEQIAKRLGIAYSTLSLYKGQYMELLEALKEGKEELVEQLEDSLYKRAMGFEFEETEMTATKDGKTQRVRKVKKFIAPDTTALIFALTNLKNEKWKHKSEVNNNINGNMKIAVDLSGLSTEELRAIAKLNG